MTIALHACCGPCLIEPLESLAADDDVIVVYANPNIAPADEYERRRDTLLAYAAQIGARVVELPYETESWRTVVSGFEHDRQARCRECYRLRLRLTAEWAASNSVGRLATTLTVSPYQDQSTLRDVGLSVADENGLEYLDRDFRDRYPAATARSRELGMYRQNYCGCVFSQQEAATDRERRRVERDAARRARTNSAATTGSADD